MCGVPRDCGCVRVECLGILGVYMCGGYKGLWVCTCVEGVGIVGVYKCLGIVGV